MSVADFLLSVLASILAISVVYALYIASAQYCKSRRATAECWWLKNVRSFRFVVRNMRGDSNLTDIRYRIWLRTIIPSAPGISVKTFVDHDVASGERILLPKRQDLPLLCFRIEETTSGLALVITDKIGTSVRALPVAADIGYLMFEYSARMRNWHLFKHEISRLYALPQYIDVGHRNLFREYLLPIQSGQEQQAKSVLELAEETTVTV